MNFFILRSLFVLTSGLSASDKSLVAAEEKACEWNQLNIDFNKCHLEVWQNEIESANIVMGSDKWNEILGKSKIKKWPGFGTNKKEHLGLQNHSDLVSFKNIKINELK